MFSKLPDSPGTAAAVNRAATRLDSRERSDRRASTPRQPLPGLFGYRLPEYAASEPP